MKIIVGKFSGFCIGVKKAIYRISKELNSNDKPMIYGEIIHNPQTVSVLNFRGLKKIPDLKSIDNRKIAIRTHGIPFRELKDINKRALQTINLTCSKVARVQGIIKKYSGEGFFTVILGDKNHAEVESLKSYAKTGYIVISKLEELAGLEKNKRMILVSQTTLNTDFFRECENYLQKNSFEIKIFNTICDSTQNRQNELLSYIDLGVNKVVVIGGKNSGNTKRLAEISGDRGISTFLIEDASEIEEKYFERNDRVFVTAGASTPSWIINNVIAKLHYIKNMKSNFFLKFLFILNLSFQKLKMAEIISGMFILGLVSVISGTEYSLNFYLLAAFLLLLANIVFSLQSSFVLPSQGIENKAGRYVPSVLIFLSIFTLLLNYFTEKNIFVTLLVFLVLIFMISIFLSGRLPVIISNKFLLLLCSRNISGSLLITMIIYSLYNNDFSIADIFLASEIFLLFYIKNSIIELINYEKDIITGNQTAFTLFGKKEVIKFICIAVFLITTGNILYTFKLSGFIMIFTILDIIYLTMMFYLFRIYYLYELKFKIISDYVLIGFIGLIILLDHIV
ncbi:MAG: 4-hydroxy-3-methylbut-2-enyl diphosphate reductase [Spirochaetes bacterium]|nr:4-hydroxy-3-methylbut-2-enyl diphosphate reductase [Spirochaetota bacterium]